MASQPSPPAAQQRVIRVFASSTFKDMQAEREELVKRIFPQLRKLCEERGVTWSEVDLRWGITDEQAAEGKVLPICLDEIHRCRPYFIGLLGERYGWVPDEIPQELIELQPWLAEHLERSVTELEILHGVLNSPDMASHAYFYLRDPAYVSTLPPGEQAAYCEGPTPYEIEKLGPEEAERRAEERRNRLEALKERIKNSDFPVHEDYQDPVQLGGLVLRDLTALVDRLYPRGSEPDPLHREAAEHEAFAASRAGVYIGRQAYFERLDNHAQGEEPPLVVLGESGSGKSALLANWAFRHRSSHPDDLLLMHFIGATPHSADWKAMLRRIMGELQRRLDIEGEIPDEPDVLRAAFANWLQMAAARGRVVLILDALDQLEDRDAAPDLVWLPPQIPRNVRMVLSTLSGRPLEELEKRAWPTLRVEPLQPDERKRLIKEYLAQYSKVLSPNRMESIAGAPQTASPLYLRALLEELRVFGIHEELDHRIGHYLSATSVDGLYEKILERYEDDYERDRPGLVREGMSLLWAARHGLSQAELLDLLGSEEEPLPGAYWSPLYLAAEQSLVSRAGLIGFFHDYLRQAVQNRYLASEQEQQAAHLRLADYFEARDLNERKIEELPWQLAQASSWQRLYDVLADLPFFKPAFEANQFDVKAYWAQVEANSPLRLVQAYQSVLNAPARNTDYLWQLATLMNDTGHPTEALSLRESQVEHYRRVGDSRKLAAALGNQALIVRDGGDPDGAMALHKEEERICRELGYEQGLQTSLGNQALILKDRGDLDRALSLHKEQERVSRELGYKHGLLASLGSQALILEDRGDPDGAMALHKEEERICRELGDKRGLLHSINNQSGILYRRGDLYGAMALYEEQERICRELGYKHGLQASLGNQALILKDRGDLDGAMALHKEEERICRELGHKVGLQRTLGNQALILKDRGDLDGAMALHKEKERICRELGYKQGLSASLNNQANILYARGDLDGAMALHKEKERICRELGYKQGLQSSLGAQANILRGRGDLDGAMALHKEEERICRELGYKQGLQTSLGNQANVLRGRGDLDGAMALHKEEERICRELGYKKELARSLSNQAAILKQRQDQDGVLVLRREEEGIRRELDDKPKLARCLRSQALILHTRGDVEPAMVLYKEEEQLRRALGDKQGVARSLGNQALILKQRRDLEGAMALYEEQEQLRRELDDRRGLARSLRSRALTLDDLGDGEKALLLFKQEEQLRREFGDREELAECLGSQGVILKQQGDLEGAMALYREQERISREEGYKKELARSLANQGRILKQRGDLDGAVDLWGEEEQLRRGLGDKQKLARSLANQAAILRDRKDLDGALALYKEQEQICRELEDKQGLHVCLGNQAYILGVRKDRIAALDLYKEKEQICREVGDADGIARSLCNEAVLLAELGKPGEALALAEEAHSLVTSRGLTSLTQQIEQILDFVRRKSSQ